MCGMLLLFFFRNQRNKLKLDNISMNSPERHRPLRHLYSSDNMHVPAFNIPNLRIDQRKTSSAEDMARKNSAGTCYLIFFVLKLTALPSLLKRVARLLISLEHLAIAYINSSVAAALSNINICLIVPTQTDLARNSKPLKFLTRCPMHSISMFLLLLNTVKYLY